MSSSRWARDDDTRARVIDRFVTGSWRPPSGIDGGQAGDDENVISDDGGFEDLETGEVIGKMSGADEDGGNDGSDEDKDQLALDDEASEEAMRSCRILTLTRTLIWGLCQISAPDPTLTVTNIPDVTHIC